MNIFIFGTKNGGRLLYPSEDYNNPVFHDFRIIKDKSKRGEKFYSIEYTNSGVAITKWIIGYDVQRGSYGVIAIAVELLKDEKLEGDRIISLLDNLLSFYEKEYISDKFEIEDKNINWTFVDKIKQDYEDDLKPITNEDDIIFYQQDDQNKKEPAYIYYSSREQLKEYLNNPYYEKYNKHKLVFFVSSNYKDKENNPLDVIPVDKNSDFTHEKILDNLPYQICYQSNSNNVFTNVSANEENIKNNERIHPSSIIKIVFSKINYKDKKIEGTIEELKASKYINIEENVKKIIISSPNNLDPKEETINFKIKKWDGTKIKNADITLRSIEHGEKQCTGDQFVFEADEIDKSWTAIVKHDKLEGKSDPFVPKDNNNTITVILHEELKITFKVTDGKNAINDYTLEVNGQRKPHKEGVVFNDSDINRKNRIRIIPNEKHLETLERDFNPSKNNAEFKLKNKTSYSVNPGKFGSFENSSKEILSYDRNGADLGKGIIDANKGYRFTGKFILEDGELIAQYDKVKPFYRNWKVLSGAAAILVLLSLGFVIFGASTPEVVKEKSANYETILAFTKSDSISLNEIKSIIDIVEKELNDTTGSQIQEERSVLSLIFSSEEETIIEKDTLKWKNLAMRLDSLKLIREAINDGQVDSLIKLSRNFKFSEQQGAFETAVKNIDTVYSKRIGDAMRGTDDKVSLMDLNQVAEFIKNFQEILRKEEGLNNPTIEKLKDIQSEINKNLLLEPEEFLPTANQFRSEILERIEKSLNNEIGSLEEEPQQREMPEEISQPDKPEQNKTDPPKNGGTKELKTTTDPDKSNQEENFEKEFWELIRSQNLTSSDLNEFIKKYESISEENEIKKFCKIYSTPNNFKKLKGMNKEDLKNAETIQTLESYIEQQ